MQLTPPAGPPPDPGPLIPREDLPAAVAPARAPRRPTTPTPPDPARRQLSLFGVEAAEPSPADLAGLLAGPGRLVRMGGTARVSVQVDAAWRVHVLIAELSARGLEVTWAPVTGGRGGPDADDRALDPDDDAHDFGADEFDPDPVYPDPADPDPADPDPADPDPADPDPADPDPGPGPPGLKTASPDMRNRRSGARSADSPDAAQAVRREGDAESASDDHGHDGGTGTGGSPGRGVARFEVRTAYSSLLAGLARAWLVGTAKRAPDRFFLTGPGLRLWAAAAGAPVAGGYVLGLDPDDGPDGWSKIDAALTRAGLAGAVTEGLAGAVTDGPAYLISGRGRLARLAELVGERPSPAPNESWPGVWHA